MFRNARATARPLGRWAGVPSLLIMAVGFALLSASIALRSWPVLLLGSGFLGVGNALSSGLVMTVGQVAA